MKLNTVNYYNILWRHAKFLEITFSRVATTDTFEYLNNFLSFVNKIINATITVASRSHQMEKLHKPPASNRNSSNMNKVNFNKSDNCMIPTDFFAH